jgi:biotin carboxyl carrier protein
MALKFSVEGEAREIEIVRRKPCLVLRISGREYEVAEERGEEPSRRMRVNGRFVDFVAARDGTMSFVRLDGRTWRIATVDPRDNSAGLAGGSDIRAPMPGVIVSLHKQEGEAVKRGETVVTIESMKLQMALPAPRDGIIARLLKKANETFDKDEVVATLAADGVE